MDAAEWTVPDVVAFLDDLEYHRNLVRIASGGEWPEETVSRVAVIFRALMAEGANVVTALRVATDAERKLREPHLDSDLTM